MQYTDEKPISTTTSNAKNRRRRRGGRWILLAAAVLATVLILQMPKIFRFVQPALSRGLSSVISPEAASPTATVSPSATPTVTPSDEEIIAALPENLQELYEKNPETLDFVKGFADWDGTIGTISQDELTGDVPLFLQWDTRWGYTEYGSDIMASTGCGPTCMSMVYTYLTEDISRSPRDMADFCVEMGYYVPGSGTAWALMTDGAAQLGLQSTVLPLDEGSMIQALQADQPIICNVGPGDFTDNGHFIVIRGYEDGAFLVNDPFSVIRSEQVWTYDTLAPQILNLWAFSLA
jgi:hypothetical protein